MQPDLLRNTTILGKLVRLPLRAVPASMVTKIVAGPLRGMRWRVGSSVHGCWLGTYEAKKVKAIESYLRPGMVVYDLGANAGYYTLLFARRAGPTGRVVAFEPFAENLRNMLDHIRWNRLANCQVVQAAVASQRGLATFIPGGANSMGAIARQEGVIRVPTVALDELIDGEGFPVPELVKMDIEGAEGDALEGARRLLERRKTVWFIALHGAGPRERVGETLMAAGYSVRALDGAPLSGSAAGWREEEILALPSRRE
ncbi:MAG: FkbM family methyltransferase [Myxococcales bacterium]